jgi:hypothetical protein
MSEDPTNLHGGSETRRGKLEIRTVLIIVAALLVIGAVYSLLFGSPTRHRAGVDSQNANPYPAAQTQNTGAPTRP